MKIESWEIQKRYIVLAGPELTTKGFQEIHNCNSREEAAKQVGPGSKAFLMGSNETLGQAMVRCFKLYSPINEMSEQKKKNLPWKTKKGNEAPFPVSL